MMMRASHETFAVPIAMTEIEIGLVFTTIPWWVLLVAGALIIHSSDYPDLDHAPASINRDLLFISKAIGILVRWVSWKVWLWTKNSQDRLPPWGDCHRGFTHCVEGCLVFASVVGATTAAIPGIGHYWWMWASATFIGCLSHVVADWPSPSGVPLSIIYNWLKGGPVWKRHRFGKMESFRVGTEGEHKVIVVVWITSTLMLLTYTGFAGPLIHVLTGGYITIAAPIMFLILAAVITLIISGVYLTGKRKR